MNKKMIIENIGVFTVREKIQKEKSMRTESVLFLLLFFAFIWSTKKLNIIC